MWNHISRDYTFVSSKRLGVALGRVIADPTSVPQFRAQLTDFGQPPPVDFTPIGNADPDALNAAMAFFMYTATADAAYRSHISRRVLALLEKDESFGFMMDDTRARIAALAADNKALLYDTSALKGTPITLSGISHCNSDPAVQWVYIDGVMNFSYLRPPSEHKAPTPWRGSAHIFIPIVVEDGVRKFDGYCPEPSVPPA
jgi:hypothetical protein